MAEKPGELKEVDKLDPVSTTAGAGTDPFLDRYSEDDEVRELRTTEDEDAGDKTEHIRAQIEETRNQLGETIDAIQERLSYENISEQVSETVSSAIETAKDTAYDATIGKAVSFMKNIGDGVSSSNAFQVVRRNPFPFALIGIGAGLLAYQSLGGRRGTLYGNGGSRKQLYGGPEPSIGSERRTSGSGSTFNAVSERASAAVDTVTNAASNAASGVKEAFDRAYNDAGEMAHRVYERAEEFGHIAHEKYDEYLDENPLALGAIALGLGAAVGFALPSSQYEGQLMGEARENFMQRAQDAAGSLVDKAKHVASEAGETIKQETQSLSH